MNIKEMQTVDQAALKVIGKRLEAAGIRVRAEFEGTCLKRVDLFDGEKGPLLFAFFAESYSPKFMTGKIKLQEKFRLHGTFLKGTIPIDVEFDTEEEAKQKKDFIEENYQESTSLEIETINKEVKTETDSIPF